MVPLAGSWKASERGPQSPYKQEEEEACRGAIQVGGRWTPAAVLQGTQPSR